MQVKSLPKQDNSTTFYPSKSQNGLFYGFFSFIFLVKIMFRVYFKRNNVLFLTQVKESMK